MRRFYIARRYASIIIALIFIPLGIFHLNENRNTALFIIGLSVVSIIYNFLMLRRYKPSSKVKEND